MAPRSTVSKVSFTLIELLVVVAIIAVLASLLLPSLSQARKRAKVSLCTTQLRQHGIAFGSYQNDFDGYFPVFGGDLIYPSDPAKATKSTENQRPWKLAGNSSLAYLADYQPEVRVNYCPVSDFRSFGTNPKPIYGEYTFVNPANSRYHQDLNIGYNFYTGRMTGKGTGSHHHMDTTKRRFDPTEITATDHLNRWINASTNSWGYTSVNPASPWLNPHVDRSAQPLPRGSANQMLADGSVHLVNMEQKLTEPFQYNGYTRSYMVGSRLGKFPDYYYVYGGN